MVKCKKCGHEVEDIINNQCADCNNIICMDCVWSCADGSVVHICDRCLLKYGKPCRVCRIRACTEYCPCFPEDKECDICCNCIKNAIVAHKRSVNIKG